MKCKKEFKIEGVRNGYRLDLCETCEFYEDEKSKRDQYEQEETIRDFNEQWYSDDNAEDMHWNTD